MKTKIYRHGDINFYPVDRVEGEEIKHNGRFVLELGETTGHRHLITVERQSDMVIRQAPNGRFYITLKAPAKITHEEHGTVTVQPGTYIKIKEREFDWFSLTKRLVVD